MKVSVIIPAHNEEKVIEKTLKKTLDVLKRAKFAYEIILVDDNSNDKTGEVAEKLSRKNKRIKILHKKARKKGPTGMGSALKFGFKHSTGDILIPFMGDLSDDPRHIPKLVNKLLDGYDVVCGSRFIKGGHLKDYPKAKFLINRLWNNVFDFLFGLGITDTSNAFKAYRREVIKKIKPKSNGFDITAEIVLKAHILKFKIIEVPVSWHGRTKGESKFGSFSFIYTITKIPKIGYQYGTLALKLWFKFLSKKIKEGLNIGL